MTNPAPPVPTIANDGVVGVPEKTGEARGALSAKSVSSARVPFLSCSV